MRWNFSDESRDERVAARVELAGPVPCRRQVRILPDAPVTAGRDFHLEHVLPESRGGPTKIDNLAWCCPSCNLHKSNRIEAVDPETGRLVPIFDPRRDRWTELFFWHYDRLVGISPAGRATVEALGPNSERRLLIRRAEQRFGLFPPT